MSRHRTGPGSLAALGLLAVLALPAWADPPKPPAGADDALKLAARIDELIDARLAAAGVKPADLADDGAVLRRLHLDVAGKVPPLAETRRFLADPAADKRRRLIERLLASPGYVTHFSAIWRDLLMGETDTDFQRRFLTLGMEAWLRLQFADDVPYDQMVRALVTLPVAAGTNSRVRARPFNLQADPSPLAYYQAKNGKPEEVAAGVTRLFLGIRLECAQCHDHPFAQWTREQFWEQASFFAGLRSDGNNFFSQVNEVLDRRELPIPNTERVVQARFLDGREPQWKYKTSARVTLADWMTAKDNPFFARAAVNRLWGHFFGIGIVDPVDDFNSDNQPSHPELLDELAREFAGHGFDLKFLIRAITLSKTYQRSSLHPAGEPPDARLFARMSVRGLSPEQLYDSVAQATGMPVRQRNPQDFFGLNDPRQQFLNKFSHQDRRTEFRTSIPQALALMNSALIGEATHPDRSNTLAGLLNAPFLTTPERLEAMYLAALCRKPRPDEVAKVQSYLDGSSDKKKAQADVFWALLNSTEFILNH